jgi:hypothetical protein
MSLEVDCSCGKRLVVRPELAGKRVRCSACQAIVEVPAPEEAEQPQDTYQAEPFVKCPSCRKEWPEGTAVCTECGHNFRSGKKLKTVRRIRDRFIDLGIPALGTYKRYAVCTDAKGRRTLVIRRWLLWIPLWSTTIELKGYDSVLTDYELVTTENEQHDWFPLILSGPGKKPREIWSGSNEDSMHALVDLLREAAGLTVGRR